jgi:glycosyltransferase involved in cell wall biosynthesis
MRIAFLSVSSQLGGSETVLLDLLRELPGLRPGWTLHLLAPSDGPLIGRASAAGAAVHVVPMPPGLASTGEWSGRGRFIRLSKALAAAAVGLPAFERRITGTLRTIAPDVIHSNGLKAHVTAARSSVRSRRLWHLHDYLSPRPLSRRLLGHYAPRCDAWVANSASVAADARPVIGTRTGRIEAVVPNGVDLARFGRTVVPADLDAMAGLPAGGPDLLRVGLVATFARWKGHEVFLRALAQLPGHVPVRGYVIGGPLYDTGGSQHSLDELRALAREAGCEGRVGFTGFQTDMPAVMGALDMVVHASTEPEPFGLVLIEAMAAGRPLITTALGGASELVTPGVDALIHRAGDPRSLAQAIVELAGDPGRRRCLAAAGRSRAAEYDVRRFAEQFAGIYERTVDA